LAYSTDSIIVTMHFLEGLVELTTLTKVFSIHSK